MTNETIPLPTEPPLRSELFSIAQLAAHAELLATTHRVEERGGANELLACLERNEAILRAFNHSTLAVDPARRITPAAEWMLDNFYLIEEQVQMARRHLPRRYNRELPRLVEGPLAGFPRVYDLVLEFIAHVDAQLDAVPLSAYIAAYQSKVPLKLGELWAVPIMLRLGLLENLKRIATKLALARRHRNLASDWIDRLQEMAGRDPSHLVIVVADMARADLPMTSAFVAEFCRLLSQQSPVVHLARSWLEQRLAANGLAIEQLVERESQNQAADQVSVSHSITSLRFLSTMDWKEFVETLSVVDQTLRRDPAQVYGQMDFATRDDYRHAVEAIARHSAASELEVARHAVALAEAAAARMEPGHRTAHVGYYLIDQGQPQLHRGVQARWPWPVMLERYIHRFPLVYYAGGIGLLTGLATVGLLRHVHDFVAAGWLRGLLGVLLLVTVSQFAVVLLNWISTQLVRPRLLPRLDFSGGIDPGCRVMVVVPTMLTSPEAVDRLVEQLEIHHLANRDSHLHFALLTDFGDAPAAEMPHDAALVRRVRAGIGILNRKYPGERDDRFFLFHRPRRWNAQERVWMGYERKRGKLAEFNALLRGGPADCFSEIVGDLQILPNVKYVITLDSDTQLPRDSARQLAGTMAHPLNRPVFDEATGIVIAGYGILQPRLGVSLPSASRSWFGRLFAGDSGIDPYTRAVSDVYQDVFQEGSFIGKGIYDVDAFERAMAGRFPENRILSHDLLEACHARSALVSDVELFEEHPSRYIVDTGRRHRWIRGDWQITPWLFPRVPGPGGRRIPNPLSPLSQWKIFDNLRRSLVPVALLLLLAVGWLLVPALEGHVTVLVLAVLLGPGLLNALAALLAIPPDLPLALHLRTTLAAAGRQVAQGFIAIVFLPYDAFISADAIGRTLLRLLVTRRRLLEWKTSSEAERTATATLGGFFRQMAVAPLVAAGLAATVGWWQPEILPTIGPWLVAWLASPAIAWWISQPVASRRLDLSADQTRFLRRIARRTWHFFETFVTAAENWLPPDNFQEEPAPVVAGRTSPTNIGMALLSRQAACDFGYVTVDRLVRETQQTFGTLRQLERHRGHFFNWYDTRTLQPLAPRYVSTVDSGNLAGHLLTFAAGLRELREAPIISPSVVLAGLEDTAAVLTGFVGDQPALASFRAELASPPVTLGAIHDRLQRLAVQAGRVVEACSAAGEPAIRWGHALQRDCEAHLADLRHLAPWLDGGEPVAAGESADRIDRIPTLRELADLAPVGAVETAGIPVAPASSAVETRGAGDDAAHHPAFAAGADPRAEIRRRASDRMHALESLACEAEEFADEMDFTFLFDPSRDLFSIGFNLTDNRLDASYYDLLASEARLGSYVAIAAGQVPRDHWFALGRLLVGHRGQPLLVSWSGSMFEYLMPMLVMPSYEGTLLDQTCRAAVRQQIAYGNSRQVPWGISESGYHQIDVHHNYQYRAFGVPGLGLKRGLADDLVIAPYATLMALMVAPREACENLARLDAEGRQGTYGFFEAIDYTPSRLPRGQSSVALRSYMAHHQGMGLLALLHLLHRQPMQRRFLACPALKATELLLQERMPNAAATIFPEQMELEHSRALAVDAGSVMRVFTDPSGQMPEVHLLSNGRYHVMISSAGGGYSRWRNLALTRWREDPTRDCWGTFIYLRDLDSGEYWSAAHQPALRAARRYEVIYTQARAEFRQFRDGLEIHTEICVSPEDDVELRRVTLTNRSDNARVIELTSYAEVVLAPAAADAAHPAFSNLFVQTEFVREADAILCTRRARSEEETPPWMLHLLASQGAEAGEVSGETDRSRFVGRGRSLAAPAALDTAAPLSNTDGSVLDPVMALRRVVTVAPGQTARIDFVFGATETRPAALALADKYRNPRFVERAFELAWTHSQVTLRHLDASEPEAQLYGRLASALVYADPARRARASVLLHNRRGQSGLWTYGISGDLPILLLRISDAEKIELVRQLIHAHSYWRMKGLAAELVIVNEDVSVYRQSLQEEITGLIASGIEAQMLDKPGGIFVRRLEQIPNEDRILLQSVARVVIDADHGMLAQQLDLRRVAEPKVPLLEPVRPPAPEVAAPAPRRDLLFPNGLGGFTHDGREYVITLEPGRMTPAPWVNVLANPHFGTVVSETGGAYTWVENAHEFRLTPWNNDPVQDGSGEAFYLRDEHTGQFWSPTPLPARGRTPYVIRHGFGYTVFEHSEYGIVSELWVYVALDAPVKLAVLKVRNLSGRPRRLSLTGYCEWVLGELRPKTMLHVQTEIDSRTGALLARNPYNTEFPDRVAFVDVSDPARTFTGDRREFLGRNGTPAQPAALRRTRLSGRTGAGLDPCAAVQVAFDLPDGQERETSFRLGVGRGTADTQTLIQRFRRGDAPRQALEAVWEYWKRTLGTVNLDTPDPAVNMLANGWLLYQALGCRLWARSGFYQSGGAFGFRDQLQDVMALVHAEPRLVREHLLRAAAQQFREGDVQHWWHPPAGRGVRTHFSDDYLWLPYATCRYVTSVGDTGVLDEMIPFLEGRPVAPDEEAYYDLPNRSGDMATLYEHCVRAVRHGLRFGEHGLPLMGCGDWNDGMNRVGHLGRGESGWLAFFLHDVLIQFAALARGRQDEGFAAECDRAAAQLREDIAQHLWDGEWYRRAYFDAGEPLGSRMNPECRIDSLPQSWAVITGVGDPARARRAMAAVNQHLVREEAGLIQLFTPPFDTSPLNPGYIKGYIPGVRENGGQYTHGAIWTVMAFAALGETERAWELFRMLNPIRHAASPAGMMTYKVEPYVVAADVYGVAPHVGRGGWTWYTGSAGWMYRLLTESLLGVHLEQGNRLRLAPRFPDGWPSFKLHYRYHHATYHITIQRVDEESGAGAIVLDGQAIEGDVLPLHDDGREHFAEVRVRRAPVPAAGLPA